MKNLIRKKCFETNSSSCHSISIESSDSVSLLESITPNEDGLILIEPMEFGWEKETFHDAISKLSYMLIYVRDWVEDERKSDFQEILKQVVLSHTQALEVQLDENSNAQYPEGHIDHQSVESKDLHYLFDYPEKLRDFIFNPDSFLQTDNDNQ